MSSATANNHLRCPYPEIHLRDDAVIAHQLAQVTERFLQTPDMMVEKSIIQDSVGRALVHANRLLLRTSLDRTFEAYPETSHTFDGIKF